MTPTQRQYIIEELTILLVREPSEDEIQNAITDIYIMGKVQQRQVQDLLKK